MDIQSIRDVYHARPFRAFDIVLSNGERVAVYSADCMAISPSGRRLVVVGRRSGWSNVELGDVASLEFSPADAKNKPA